jgi:Na+/melibiose symporter-like transporter
MSRIRERYGAGPGHLLLLLASFAIAGAAIVGWFQRPNDLEHVLIWFVAAVLLHDLVLLPLYSLLDRLTIARLPRRSIAYVRVPAIVSGLLLLVLFPTILGFAAHREFRASGIHEHGYLLRWLVLTGALFTLSGLAYALARVRCAN